MLSDDIKEILVSEEQIESMCKQLGKQLSDDYRNNTASAARAARRARGSAYRRTCLPGISSCCPKPARWSWARATTWAGPRAERGPS